MAKTKLLLHVVPSDILHTLCPLEKLLQHENDACSKVHHGSHEGHEHVQTPLHSAGAHITRAIDAALLEATLSKRLQPYQYLKKIQ